MIELTNLELLSHHQILSHALPFMCVYVRERERERERKREGEREKRGVVITKKVIHSCCTSSLCVTLPLTLGTMPSLSS